MIENYVNMFIQKIPKLEKHRILLEQVDYIPNWNNITTIPKMSYLYLFNKKNFILRQGYLLKLDIPYIRINKNPEQKSLFKVYNFENYICFYTLVKPNINYEYTPLANKSKDRKQMDKLIESIDKLDTITIVKKKPGVNEKID